MKSNKFVQRIKLSIKKNLYRLLAVSIILSSVGIIGTIVLTYDLSYYHEKTKHISQQRFIIERIARLVIIAQTDVALEKKQMIIQSLQESIRLLNKNQDYLILLSQNQVVEYFLNTIYPTASVQDINLRLNSYIQNTERAMQSYLQQDFVQLNKVAEIYLSDTPTLLVSAYSQWYYYYEEQLWFINLLILTVSILVILGFISCGIYAYVYVISPLITRMKTYRGETYNQRQAFNVEKKQVKQETKNKAHYFGYLSFELKNPLSGIVGITQLLKRTQLNKQQGFYVKKVEHSIIQLLDTINQLIDYSKIESESLVIEKKDFNILRLVDEVINEMEQLAQEKNLGFHARVGMDIPVIVLGDADKLKQIIRQLVMNAVYFTDQGEVTLSLRLHSKQDNHIELLLNVSDTGRGLSQQQIDEIFQPFHRIGGTERASAGLGLTIIKNIIELMGGSINCQSVEGKGTNFYCHIPLIEVSMNEPLIKPELLLDKISKLIILVIDDDPIIIDLICTILKKLHIKTVGFSQASEAYAYFVRQYELGNQIDIVLTDWEMPEINGEQLAQKMRNFVIGLEYSIPKFVLISSFQAGDAPSYERLLFHAVLKKPFNVDSLVHTMLGLVNIHFERSMNILVNHLGLVGRRVLLVEDNEINQLVISQLLLRHDLWVDISQSGEEALARLEEQDYDIILLDIQLPNMDGIEITKRIRSDPQLQNLAIIAITAYTDQHTYQRCIAAKMNGYLTKPIKEEPLLSMIADCLAGKLLPGLQRVDFESESLALLEESRLIKLQQDDKEVKEEISLFTDRYRGFEQSLNTLLTQENWPQIANYLEIIQTQAEQLKLIKLAHETDELIQLIQEEQFNTVSHKISDYYQVWYSTQGVLDHFLLSSK